MISQQCGVGEGGFSNLDSDQVRPRWDARWGSSVALFMSTIINKIDRKGRVSVPASFRPHLSGPGTPPNGMLVLFRSYQYDALEGFTLERMADLSARLDTLEQFSPEHDSLATIFADAQQLTLDSEGRVGLPEDLIDFAHIAFVGLGGTFQVWEPVAFAAHKQSMRERLREKNMTVPTGRPAPHPVAP
jgi:MraZ protein